MKKYILNITKILIAVVFISFAMTVSTKAVEKEVEFVDHQSDDDLAVNFQFDKENVDIVLISPSGREYSANSSGVQYAEGELWCTFRIESPEKGKWSVRYDLKRNESIEFSVINDNYGLVLESFEKTGIEDDSISFNINAKYNGEDVYYNYIISAVSILNNDEYSVIGEGRVYANKDNEVKAKLEYLPSGEYILRADISYLDGEIELTDSKVLNDTFKYDNPNEPKTINDFVVKVNTFANVVDVDWSREFYGCSESKIIIKSDDEVVYEEKLDDSFTSISAQIKDDTKNLSISLAGRYYNVWLSPLVKEINLENEGLNLKTSNVTSDNFAIVSYKTTGDKTLYTEYEGEKNQYEITGEGEISFSLVNDINHINAYFVTDENITYYIDDDVIFDAYPPEIILFEEYDGKRFGSENIHILGMVKGGDRLLINEEEVALDENGNFDKDISLSEGENVFELVASDVNNNTSSTTLTLLYGTSLISSKGNKNTGIFKYIPLFSGLIVSLIIIILSLMFMKKKDAAKKGVFSITPWIIWNIILLAGVVLDAVLTYRRYMFTKSLAFLEMAEKSAQEALTYISTFKYMLIGGIIGLVVLILSIVLMIVLAKRNAKNK